MAVTHSLALVEIGDDDIWSYASEATTPGAGRPTLNPEWAPGDRKRTKRLFNDLIRSDLIAYGQESPPPKSAG